MTDLQAHLKSIGVCANARQWAGTRTPQQAWDESPRSDWLLWWVGKSPNPHNTKDKIVSVACRIARLALHLVPDLDLRPLWAIEAAERWIVDPTEDNRTAANVAAYAANVAAYAANVAAVAAYAANAAAAAVYAANVAAAAAYAAAAAAMAAYAADAADAAAMAAYAADAAAMAAYAADAAAMAAYAADAAAMAALSKDILSIIRDELVCPI